MTTRTPLICHLHQAACGRIAGEPVCSKCGIDGRVRYVTEEAAQLAKAQATDKYWQNEAVDNEWRATQAVIERAKSEEARVQARKVVKESASQNTFQDHPLAPPMVLLPSGSFWMGSVYEGSMVGHDNERPQHQVSIGYKLAMGRYPVTFEEWDTCVSDGGVNHQPSDHGWGRGKRPAINVNWHDAQAYVSWLNKKLGIAATDPHRYRLPSEAEWEYACRAGSLTRWCFGDDQSQLTDCAWFSDNSADNTQPIGQKKPNAWGLYDMHGNVWEWVQDVWVDNYNDAPLNGEARREQKEVTANQRASFGGDEPYRVRRGGSWDGYARDTLAANRNLISPVYRNFNIGFRIARTLP